jgi:hypothetical protein
VWPHGLTLPWQGRANREDRGTPCHPPLPCSPATFLSPLCYMLVSSPILQQKVASAVAWETRERGGRYYTRSRRSPEDGRVVREYVGSGPLAEIVAEEDRTKRELAEAERKREKTELERLKALAAPVLEISEAAEILAHAHLIAAGYHRHKGEYRRARGKR